MQINSSMSILQNSYLYQSSNAVNSAQNTESKQSLLNEDSNIQDSTQNTNKTQNTESQFGEKAPNGETLDPQQTQALNELKAIDRNVRAHEAAHVGAGGGVVAGGASYTYTRGPDGQMYATAGEVPIRMQKGKTPEETIQNARRIIAAAMAPSDPSPQDYKVAASAAQMEVSARAEQARENAKEVEKTIKGEDNSTNDSALQDSSVTNNVTQNKESSDSAMPQESQGVGFINQGKNSTQTSGIVMQEIPAQPTSAADMRIYALQSYQANTYTNKSPFFEIAG
ncbi:putative metalloprotease CJM1_0395 family protein [Helicobacter sp.]|uniref:putative metalloprotease CJM1_0395 family protein n=1 Tax=Helicobacter sp. TaxID=218 RepID=UPI0039C5BC07